MVTVPTLRYFQHLHRLALDQADDLQPAMQRIMEPSPVGSPTDNDTKTVSRSVRSEDRQRLWRQVQLDCMHMAVNVADHLRAVALLLSQPDVGVPVYAHTTAARAAIESATNVAYILDRDHPFELRFARGIAFLINNSREACRAASRVPGNAYMLAPGPAATRSHESLLAFIAHAKVELVPARNGDPKGVRVTPGGPVAPTTVKMTDLVPERYPNMPALYNLMSGVTHGMPYRLSSNAQFDNRRARWDPDPLDVGGSVLAAVNAAHTVLAAHAWHRGRDDDPAITTTRNRIAAVDQAMQCFAQEHLRLPRPAPAMPFLATGT